MRSSVRVFIFSAFALVSGGPVWAQFADSALTESNQAFIQAHFSEKIEGEACIRDFKSKMNDPSSFQFVGPFQYSDWVTQNILPMAARMDANGGPWGLPAMPDPKRNIAISARVRGKNPFGGLVLSTMQCIFWRGANWLTFVGSTTLPDNLSQ